jgi:hypothetical protein
VGRTLCNGKKFAENLWRSESAITRISYQLKSENFLHVTNIAKAHFVFGDNFIEFPLKTKLTHQHGHSKPKRSTFLWEYFLNVTVIFAAQNLN